MYKIGLKIEGIFIVIMTRPSTNLFDDAREKLFLKGVEGHGEVDQGHLDADGRQEVRVAEGRC